MRGQSSRLAAKTAWDPQPAPARITVLGAGVTAASGSMDFGCPGLGSPVVAGGARGCCANVGDGHAFWQGSGLIHRKVVELLFQRATVMFDLDHFPGRDRDGADLALEPAERFGRGELLQVREAHILEPKLGAKIVGIAIDRIGPFRRRWPDASPDPAEETCSPGERRQPAMS